MSKISSACLAEDICGCSHEVAASERTVLLRPLIGIFDDLLHLYKVNKPSAYSVFHFKHSDVRWEPCIRVLCSRLGKRTFPPWTTERLKGERYGTHSLGQVCPERMFLTFLHSTPTLQAVGQPCFANALTGSRNARLSYGFRRKPTTSDFHFIRMSVLILTPLQYISYARNP